MPFGAVFGALFFLVLGIWLAVSPLSPDWAHPVAGRIFLAVLSLALALGLLLRRNWARWGGATFAAALALAVMTLGPLGTGTAAFLVLFGSLAVAVALFVPASGRIAGPAGTASGAPRVGRVLALAALVGAAGVGASVVWGLSRDEPASGATRPVAIAGLERVQWTDYGSGLERARAEGRPMVVAFETSWCGYCRKMRDTTWKAPSVIDRMNDDVIAVRVDAEEAVERSGYTGRDLAARFGVYGYPTMLLIDPDGEVVARAGGFMEPREFLGWLDRSLKDEDVTDTAHARRI